MPDLTIDAALVRADDAAAVDDIIVGEDCTAGQVLYRSDTDGKYYRAFSTGTEIQAGSGGVRIALSTAPGSNQRIVGVRSGLVHIGATLSAGQVYVISDTPGKIKTHADHAASAGRHPWYT